MFGAIKSLMGDLDVTVENGIVTIEGVRQRNLINDIYRYWNTKRIAENIFVKKSSYSISFYEFYAVEMLYMIRELSEQNVLRLPKSTYNNLIKELTEKTWIKNTTKKFPDILDSSKLSLFFKKPLPHQNTFFQLYNEKTQEYNLKGYVLALDTGAGKTLTSLMTAEQLGVDNIITICPARALYNVWQKAYLTEYRRPQKCWASQDKESLDIKKDPKGIILHYESLIDHIDYIRDLSKKGRRLALIIDESHNFNEITSQRTQLLMELSREINFVTTLWLSATPIKALGSEMIPMMTTLDNLMTPDVANSFKAIFGKNAMKGGDIVKHRMGLMSYIVKIEKSKPTFFDIPVEIPDSSPFLLENIKKDMRIFIDERLKHYKDKEEWYSAIYNEGLETYKKSRNYDKNAFREYLEDVQLLRKGVDPSFFSTLAKRTNDFEKNEIDPTLPQSQRKDWRDSKSVIKYVDLKVRGEALGRIVGKKRAEVVVAMIPHIGLEEIIKNSEKKVVIFTSYVIGVEKTLEYLESKGIKALYVHGDNSKEVTQVVNKFGNDPKVKVLVTTFQSLNSAMPLTMANTIVTLNSPFRDHIAQQTYGRIDRLDQDTYTEIYTCTLSTGTMENISSRSLDIMKWSKEQVETIMGKAEDHLVEISYEDYQSY